MPAEPLSTRRITTTDALAALRPEWSALWRRDPAATPFQAPEWLLPWWRHIAEGALLAVEVHSGERLVGLLPAYVYPKPGGARQLLLLGAGTSDYLGGVFAPEVALEAASAALAAMAATDGGWDEAYFSQLPQKSPLVQAAQCAGLTAVPTEPCWGVRLEPGMDFHGKIRENLRYYRRRADALGKVRFETAEAANASAFFESFLRLHEARWAARGEAGVLKPAGVQAAHRASVPALAAAGLLRMHAMLLNEQPIAAIYGLADSRMKPSPSVYFYLTGFDPAFASLSPGTLLLGYAVESAAAEGAACLDMLRGAERYKRFWKPEIRATSGFSLLPGWAPAPGAMGRQAVERA